MAPHSVMTYLALPGEIDLGRLPADRPHISWVVSRTPDTGWLTTHPLGARRERHPFGFEQPVADAAQVRLDEVDVVLVPGLAFDPHGMRLGRGKGYYDELLGRCRPDATAVGITLERRVFDRIPSEPHDRRVDWLVTEIGARCTRPA